jgi:Flp pilus assembly CpaF family ATPase
MSAKVYDHNGRWRNKTVAFRVSSEEAEQLDIYSKLSGLTKQDYLIRRVLIKEITVNGNPRVFKALRNQLANILTELQRIESISKDNDELLDIILYISEILDGLRSEEGCNAN